MHLLQFQIEEDIGSELRMYEKMYKNGSQMYLVDGLSLYHIVILHCVIGYTYALIEKETIKSAKWNIVFYGDVYATF
jgi:hypothetical protein